MKALDAFSKETFLKERTQIRNQNNNFSLNSPLNSSMQKERYIECEIEPRKYYPKSN